MRILYVVTGARYGGAPHHVLQLAQLMSDGGHTVGLVAAPEPRLMREAEGLGVSVFPNRHFVFSLSPPHDLMAFKPVMNAILDFKPDLVHCHSTKAGLVARLCAAATRTPVVFTAHGWGFGERRAWWTPVVLRWLERFAARVTAKIICVSEFDRQLALRFRIGRPSQIVVIKNGVSPEPYAKAFETDAPGGGENAADGTGPRLISVGRMAPPKDFETFVKAMRILDWGQTVVVGDGPSRESVEDMVRREGVSGRVHLLGQRDDIPNLLSASDVFVLCSKKEGLPISVIEAMLSGLPVVATRVGGLPELVEDGHTGFLVPPGDPEAVARAIRSLAEDQALRSNMGRRAREKALREFSMSRMGDETASVYQAVLGRSATVHSSARG